MRSHFGDLPDFALDRIVVFGKLVQIAVFEYEGCDVQHQSGSGRIARSS